MRDQKSGPMLDATYMQVLAEVHIGAARIKPPTTRIGPILHEGVQAPGGISASGRIRSRSAGWRARALGQWARVTWDNALDDIDAAFTR